jgi:predicted nucleic acid-binding protein
VSGAALSGAALSGTALSRSPQIVVIDASMALAWLFERQQPQDIEQANRLLGTCGESPWWVPSIWHLEVANALLVAERRSVLPQAESDCFLAKLSSLPISTDTDPLPARRLRILALARNHGISSNDATYLELAQRLGATLASFDRQLNQAASANAVKLFSEL